MARGEMRGPGEHYSGRMFENDLFGRPKWPKGFESTIKAASGERGYMKFHDAMELVRENYPEDPMNPGKDFARELRIAVCEALDLPASAWDQIRFYNAVGTPLDVYHGTDAWIEAVDLKSGRTAQVTLDASLKTEKQEYGAKADVVIGEVTDTNEDEYLQEIEAYGVMIADELKGRAKSAGIKLPTVKKAA